MTVCRKKPYQSKKAALSFRRKAKIFGNRQRVYQCAICRKWHLTTRLDGCSPLRSKVQTDLTPNPARKSISPWAAGLFDFLRLNGIEEGARRKPAIGDVVLISPDEFTPANDFMKPINGYYRVPITCEDDAIALRNYDVFTAEEAK